MAMIDLKREKPEPDKNANKLVDAPATSSYYEERPYCHRITLEKPDLERLGMTPQSFKDMKPFEATVLLDPIVIRDIESKSSEKWNENNNQSVELQVLKVDIGALSKKEEGKFGKFNDQNRKGPGE